jgi:hypothetical protein
VGPEIFNEGAHEPNGVGGNNSQALFAVVEHRSDSFQGKLDALGRTVILEASHPNGIEFTISVPVHPAIDVGIELGVAI